MCRYILAMLMGLAGFNIVLAEEHIVEVVTDHENGIVTFTPKIIEIKLGDTVKWVNKEEDLHNVITYPDGFPANAEGFSSPYLEKKGESWSYTFNTKGSYLYHCIPHIFMGMRGTVVVEEPTEPSAMNKPTMAEVVAYRTQLLSFFDDEDFQDMPDQIRRNVGSSQ